MATRRLGIIMHGVTGRMGMNQHLIRSICAIRAEGGVALANGDRVMPDPLLASMAQLQLWHIVPLVVAVSLVYGATRHELMSEMLSNALKFGRDPRDFIVPEFIAWGDPSAAG